MKKIVFFVAVGALVIWSFVSHLALPLLVAIVAMAIWAFRSDTKMWKTKPTAELVAMIEGTEWRYWQAVLNRRQRRQTRVGALFPQLPLVEFGVSD